jgi:hypothetical protein
MEGKCISGAHERPRGAGTLIHSMAIIFPDVLAPNASTRFNWNLLDDIVWMVLVEQKRRLLGCSHVHSVR